jgi:hypothetical protein
VVQFVVSHTVDKAVDDRVPKRRVDEQARGRRAGLAGVPEDAREETVDHPLDVGILEDDGRTLSPEFERHWRHVAGGTLHDALTGHATAGERHNVHILVRHQVFACVRTEARDHVQRPRREPGIVCELRDADAGERRLFCRFDHDGVARRERGCRSPG